MAAQGYFDEKKRVYVIKDGSGKPKEFAEKPGVSDYLFEGLETKDVKTTLDILRKNRMGG